MRIPRALRPDRLSDVGSVSFAAVLALALISFTSEASERLLYDAPYVAFPTGGGHRGVATADLDGDGLLDLVAGDSSDSVSVILGRENGTLGPWTKWAVQANPVAMVIRDVNHDLILDLLVANYDANSVSVLLGVGEGAFGVRHDIPVGTGPQGVAVADVDRDGHLDLVVGHSGHHPEYLESGLSIRLGNGDGTFRPGGDIAMPGGITEVCAADFDDDGNQDLAVTHWTGKKLTILAGTPSGTFVFREEHATPDLTGWVTVGDLDADGREDLVVGTHGRMLVYRGDGDGTFTPGPNYYTGYGSTMVVLADMDLDGIPDATVSSQLSGDANIWLGDGTGAFSISSGVSVGSVHTHTVGDFNSDGVPDLAIGTWELQMVALAFGATNGRLAGRRHVERLPGDALAVAAGDLNGDGHVDAVVSSRHEEEDEEGGDVYLRTRSFLPGLGNGEFGDAVHHTEISGDPVRALAIGDLDRDGVEDLVQATRQTLAVVRGVGDGSFHPPVAVLPFAGLTQLALGDLDRDGNLDVAAVSDGPDPHSYGLLSVMLGNGDGTLQHRVEYRTGRGPHAVDVGDVDEDGAPDLVTADYGYGTLSDTVSIHRNLGTGSFAAPIALEVGPGPIDLELGDLDRDGTLDLAVANESGGSITVMRGFGDGTFGERRDFATAWEPRTLNLADLDGDGALDLMVTGDWAGTASVHRNTGSGSFHPRVAYANVRYVNSALFTDLDADGRPEFLTTAEDWRALLVLHALDDSSTPTLIDRFIAEWRQGAVEIRWELSASIRGDAVLERSREDEPWTPVTSPVIRRGRESMLVDRSVTAGSRYRYRLAVQLLGGERMHFGPIEPTGGVAAAFALLPLSAQTSGTPRVEFEVPRTARVRLAVHDVQGRRVALLADGTYREGRHAAVWTDGGCPSGIYFVRMQWEGGSATRRWCRIR